MKLKEVSPKIATKELIKLRPLRSEIDNFKNNLLHLLGKVDEIEREENQKNHIRDFLLNTYYRETNEVNTKNATDLVIHLGKSNKDKVGVIMEAKRPGNKGEMLTLDKPNTKALHELVLYYMRERIDENNIDIKNCIATNVYEWFIFDAQYFEKHFAKNKDFVRQYTEWKNNQKVSKDTSLFYNEIAKPYIDSIKDEIPVTRFDIRKYKKALQDTNKEEDKSLIALYKIHSPYHLLRKSSVDSNALNDKFYKELLYIIGLEEVKESGKNVIRRKKDSRNAGSLIENIITLLETEELYKVKNVEQYGTNKDERAFNIAVELALTWVNRILFIKLLEGQLITYNRGNQQLRFLNAATIHDFDELYKLFHQILARKAEDRPAAIKEKYANVPYLNSSLFEISELEDETVKINALDNETTLELMPNSVLKGHYKNKGAIRTIEYIFDFLDAYDFASEGKDDIQEDSRTLINASVLGKVFEKINGYKDGSIYTPGFITMYMCRESIRKSVVQKFNERYGWKCESINDVHNEISNRQEANEIINSLKICDPAVGSGHFLVSALNEIIALKAELGILIDSDGKRIKEYTVDVINDELVMTDEYGDPFIYNPHSKESQRIQKTLFHEKQTIIENCLFGVDINSNSVKICRLRLWIELLKNAYYKEETNFKDLETLPNIDINIKVGNALISRYALNADLSKALKSINHTIPEYRSAVMDFKNETDREKKRKLLELIAGIKRDFQTYFSIHDERREKLSKARGELVKLQSGNLFETKKPDTTTKKKIENLEKKIEKIEQEISEIKDNVNYRNAFEWRFEFPEVLDNDGNFAGFDILIGNPPYIQLQKLGGYADCLQSQDFTTFVRTGDIYCLFYELGIHLLKPNGYLCYITSNKWMRAGYGEQLRQFFLSKCNPLELIDLAGLNIFDAATVDTNILLIEKADYKAQIQTCMLNGNIDSIKNLSDYFRQNSIETSTFTPNQSWTVLSQIEREIKTKVELVGQPLKEWNLQINRGILTGYNDAFIINGNIRNELVEKSSKNDEIIRPILRGRDIQRFYYDKSDQHLLFIPWHFPLHETDIAGASTEAERQFELQYPDVYSHLMKYKAQLTQRNKAETGIRYEWYALQRFGANYWKSFEQPKIIYPEITKFMNFTYDLNEHYFVNNKCFIITGEFLEYLTCFLNSKLFRYCFIDNFPELLGGTRELRKIFFQEIPVKEVSVSENLVFKDILSQIMFMKTNNEDSSAIESAMNNLIYNHYGLSEIEIKAIDDFDEVWRTN